MFSITTNRVRDAVKVTEGTESMILRVDFDPMAFVRVLETAKAKLAAVRYAQDDSAPQVNVEVGLNGENLVEYVSTQQQLGLQSYNMSKWKPR